MCGGVTAYVSQDIQTIMYETFMTDWRFKNACKRSKVRPGQWIVLPGAGGGLGHLAIQYAKAMGMRVIAVDGGDAKRDLCIKLGAEKFIDFMTTEDIPAEVMKITGLGAHGILVTAAAKAAYLSAPSMLRSGGTLVAVGLPADPEVSLVIQRETIRR